MDDIVCFGANVNPLGLSANVKKQLADNLDIISTYPDRNYTTLKKAISNYCGVDPENVIVGNGSTELISLLIQTKKPKKALELAPTYSEYSRELNLVGCTESLYNLRYEDNFTLSLEDFEKTISEGYDLVIICNPNNPTSSALTVSEMDKIAETCKKYHAFLMVDETYVEFTEKISDYSAMSLIQKHDNLMILRGVSKFYAAPGLRFGYGATSNKEFLKELSEKQNPWSLNHLAAFAGERMLQDSDYICATRSLILGERKRIMEELKKIPGIKPYPAYANFILNQITKGGISSSDVFEAMIKEGLMIRDCSTFESLEGEFFRFCIMNPKDNDRLLNALRNYFENTK